MPPTNRAVILLLLIASVTSVFAYVPAQPTNSSQAAAAGGLNITDISKLYLGWYPNGADQKNISYQLAGNASNGFSQGVLVHFSEAKASNLTPPTTTPWIAMIPCDFNSSTASMEEDVFTLARDKGAKAALLYSAYSLACVINPEYADPATFDQVFDIFSTQSLASARLIEYQFGQFGPVNESIYAFYDSKLLNDSASIVNQSIQLGYPAAPGYLYAILQAYNSTVQLSNTTTNNGTNSSSSTTAPNDKSPSTALAMIILYAITGCVSALFCIVIISGAIRAIRHPERYGPRRNGGNGASQSRAKGLTRAILDTFPIVKFGSSTSEGNTSTPAHSIPSKDVETLTDSHAETSAMELREWEMLDKDGSVAPSPQGVTASVKSKEETEQTLSKDVLNSDSHQAAAPAVLNNTDSSRQAGYLVAEGSYRNTVIVDGHRNDVKPDAIGRETCPICIVDFEEGDDLRVLPCKGEHRFHQACVDPWLLELSSSCPICREDFHALQKLLSKSDGHAQDDDSDHLDHRRLHGGSSASPGNRFSRYIRFAKRRHHDRRDQDEEDPTDPHTSDAQGSFVQGQSLS
ncbi:hypothetical protein L208DRAFT_1253916 [Tricholoma matsutake]|nr:hypothetical protein L208DRAFT_1253916 [Tricholoma matsutake 945]